MRNAIREYLELSEQEKKDLWISATFVFDTNVLLNLYRYSAKTRESLLHALEDLKDRIWIPHHVAEEFMKDRYKVISEYNSAFEEIKKASQEFVDKCIEKFRLNPNDAEIIEINNAITEWRTYFEEQNPRVQDFSADFILERILSLFDGKAGEGFDSDEISNIEKEGKERYANQIPPGYKDANKQKAGSDNVYGDLIIWKELLRFARSNEKDIIFITGDQKEDWWNTFKGKTIGPRVELRREFYKETRNRRFHMYTMKQFLLVFSETKGERVDDSIIDEIGKVAKEKEQTEDTNDAGRIKELEDQLVNLYNKNEKRVNAIKLIQGQLNRGAGNPEEKMIEIRNIEANISRAEKEIDRINLELKSLKARRERRQILLDEELEGIVGM